ncbi:MAG: head GIN domain-containing protein [Bacteroidales bacterium]|nr:head GIN domain-containing protein [Bacteroidales bacterium]
MKNLVSTLMTLAFLLAITTACAEKITPSKNYVTKKVNVGSFEGISTSSSVDVIYTQTSGSQSVEIYAPANLIDYIYARVEDGILKVGFKSPRNNFSISGSHKKEVRVSAPAVKSLQASSSGDIIIKNGLKADKLTLKASSSGDVVGGNISCEDLSASASSSGDVILEKVTCTNLSATASSSGDVEIKSLKAINVAAKSSSSGDVILKDGTCTNATYSASSSGDVEAKGLKAVNVVATASSSGDVSCYATGTLTARPSSSGEISYKGNPGTIDYQPKKGLRKLD